MSLPVISCDYLMAFVCSGSTALSATKVKHATTPHRVIAASVNVASLAPPQISTPYL